MPDEQEQGPKIGAGHMAAMGRAGFKEISQALQAFPGQGIQPVEEPGLIGNLTPQEIVASKGAEQGYESMLAGYAEAAPQQQKQQEMER